MVREISKQDQVNHMRRYDCPSSVIDTLEPPVARDEVPSHPHKCATQDSAQCQSRNIMTRECLCLTAVLHNQPELWQNSYHSQKQSSHPEGVKERMLIHVCVEDRCEAKRYDHCRAYAKRVLVSLVGAALHFADVVKQPRKQNQ